MNHNAYHVLDLPDGTFDAFDNDTKERYNFKTKQSARAFCRLVNEYYNSKNRQLYSAVTFTVSSAHKISGSITPTFNIPFPGVVYKLDLSKPPNLFTRAILKLMGFKR